MGDISEMMLDGTMDYITGEYLGEPCGYPRSYEDGTMWKDQRKLRYSSDKSIRTLCTNCGITDRDKQNQLVTNFLRLIGVVNIPKLPRQIEYIYLHLKDDFKSYLKNKNNEL